ncbi:unnamed protein product [Phytomonas sp. Hart1]|nr:unnamed protein product [Phytomonas sp. Hart1]|eukprot:CCW68456.1 unnamed protein product [Phytomonas sp. isolate Hart1]
MFSERIAVDQEVYYFEPQIGWSRGKINKIKGNNISVLSKVGEKVKIVPSEHIHGYIPEAYDADNTNLFNVRDLHVSTLLFCIKERFEEKKQQYSLMGEMLLSVNPFQVMQFNSNQERRKYMNEPDFNKLPPHIWQIAHKAYNSIMKLGLSNQSIVISGESGSGKTENTKSLISYLGQLSHASSDTAQQRSIADRIDDCLMWSNPVLESFGNARTVRNDNSSRFGKYIKLYFDPSSGILVGGEIVTYLLEKSRIIVQSEGERNYHVFYEMLADLSISEKQSLGGLKNAKDYSCLNGGQVFTRRGVDGNTLNDSEEFMRVRRGMKNIGIPDHVVNSIYRVLAAILFMMEITFEMDDNDKAYISNEKVFIKSCTLLKIDAGLLSNCFLIKTKSSLVTIYSSKVEAEFSRNAFCKGLYVGLFDWIVEFINRSIKPDENLTNLKYIGLLDIFGFENFDKNSFEQLCINFANETLQAHYNKDTFINDEEECEREGVVLHKVVFPDNSECIKLFTKPPNGIFPAINEQSNLKGGTSGHFTSNLWRYWKDKSPYFVVPKSTISNQFGIKHYASFVNYDTEGWTEKNSDPIKDTMYEALLSSKDEFISKLLTNAQARASRKMTIATRFQSQLNDLRINLESTETRFIRCIKPNMQARSDIMENFLVSSQLESSGVLQTIALKRQGYPVRLYLENFSRYFFLIMPRKTVKTFKSKNYSQACSELLNYYERIYGWKRPNFVLGKTKVFLKGEIWSDLDRLVVRRRSQLVKQCKRYLSRWVKEYQERKRSEQAKRIAKLKCLREEREAKGALCAHGLPGERIMWVEDIANLFPLMDMSILMDIAAEADSYERALAMVSNIHEQCVDKREMSTFINLMMSARVCPNVVKSFLESDINSIASICRITVRELKSYGCSNIEVAALTKKIMEKELKLDCLEKLSYAIGTHEEYEAAEALREMEGRLLQQDFEMKVAALVEIGFSEEDVRLVLAHYDGKVERAVTRLLSGINRKKIQQHVRKHNKYTTADPNVQHLIAMGAPKRDVKAALRTMNGDINEVAKVLFGLTCVP